jgi:ribosome-associated toxin RatA of RatAB toxin-antitoxin module
MVLVTRALFTLYPFKVLKEAWDIVSRAGGATKHKALLMYDRKRRLIELGSHVAVH